MTETITSRKNQTILHFRNLAADAGERKHSKEYICDGVKTLREALHFGAKVKTILWRKHNCGCISVSCLQYILPDDLFDFVSPMKNSPGPLFSVEIPEDAAIDSLENVIVLENVQDPGNVGTVIRTANAFNISAVILTGNCADLYHPKTVRATMGAIFRQQVLTLSIEQSARLLRDYEIPLYAAALSQSAIDIRNVSLSHAAVAIGSEGNGLTDEMLRLCDGELIIPMNPNSESLNAAVAASIAMWEMSRFHMN